MAQTEKIEKQYTDFVKKLTETDQIEESEENSLILEANLFNCEDE